MFLLCIAALLRRMPLCYAYQITLYFRAAVIIFWQHLYLAYSGVLGYHVWRLKSLVEAAMES
ncbi:MAG: hypothetical protein WA639_19320 [Candidatus Acidiferrum sp.]